MNADARVDVSKTLVISFILSLDHSFLPYFILSISTIFFYFNHPFYSNRSFYFSHSFP